MIPQALVFEVSCRRTLAVIWIPARAGGDGYEPTKAHAEVWQYSGGRTGEYVADLPDWTEEDCS